jgi:cysteine desulfurase
VTRVYLDHNATTPLRAEARAAMVAAMDVVGNPSSVHAEGRQAKALVERARAQVAGLVGGLPQQVIFTAGATEAAALAVAQKARYGGVFGALPTEHECFAVWSDAGLPAIHDRAGMLCAEGLERVRVWLGDLASRGNRSADAGGNVVALLAVSAANSETGVMLPGRRLSARGWLCDGLPEDLSCAVVCDITQMAGKVPIVFDAADRPSYLVLSAHKMGGPKGVGALINLTAEDPQAILRGGGQEMGRRSGTENVIGIAGFGAAAEAAGRDLASGRWDEIQKLRKILEKSLAEAANSTIFVGISGARLPNTSCFATPGWKGESQVIQMDLAGYAVSAGSACSSGKVRPSSVLRAMGYDDETASSAIRVSLGLETTRQDVLGFVEAWSRLERKFRARAA